MDACATVALTDGVATPQKSVFWKVIYQSTIFVTRYPKNLSVEFHKSLEFVDLARSFRFGKCFD